MSIIALQRLLEKEEGNSQKPGVILGVQSADRQIDFRGATGSAQIESPFYIASVTKMYTAAVCMQLAEEGRLDLDSEIAAFLPASLTTGLPSVKVYQLIHQTSGLPDYFAGNLAEDFMRNEDRAYTVADTVALAREAKPPGPPGSGKSHYSDTNYQLLGAIIEAAAGASLPEVFQARVFDRLGLSDSYLYNHAHIRGAEPLPFYYKDLKLSLPLALTSERGAGGVVSTLDDSLRFLRGYFGGELFDSDQFRRMMEWKALFFPLQYGYGLMRFRLPPLMNPFHRTPELIGHSGSTGSFAFFDPKKSLYLAGTFNQLDKPSQPFAFMLKVVSAVSS